ncbi:thiamine diphosphokinase [Paenibacillus sp. Marseille-Q4541]|uniref:thiamine diphosphokinase n=1 Tax=Paenibacillus sp. Marseille-Q4541 TaxID=2831522 RepID=UPI001BAD0D7F|nr:thiamine diphosphokinase [Paenibacillus sp. Marseille-Q4541]
MTIQRVIIFTGGSLEESYIKEIQSDDIVIGADYGAWFLVQHGITPELSAGDFDSVTEDQLRKIQQNSKQFVICDPINKNLSDTELALEYAMEMKPREIVIFGAIGTRLDHTLANIQIMSKVCKQGIECSIQNTHNRLTITDSVHIVHKNDFPYVSLIPLTNSVTGITLEGFMYPLQEATLSIGDSLGISNRLLGDKGTVTISEGLLLVIQSKD